MILMLRALAIVLFQLQQLIATTKPRLSGDYEIQQCPNETAERPSTNRAAHFCGSLDCLCLWSPAPRHRKHCLLRAISQNRR
uniref:Putative secreted protein n=1 Tax=Anopheles darlingi TaxID=43151 RepID=A0A2M4D6N3_ANODA